MIGNWVREVCTSTVRTSRQSLVTPIDWKRELGFVIIRTGGGHHSLVTPIDWKPVGLLSSFELPAAGHHSLVTPIDWKRFAKLSSKFNVIMVANPWWRLLIGNRSADKFSCVGGTPTSPILVTPIDWKPRNMGQAIPDQKPEVANTW